MGLSAPKNRTKLSADPNNTAWAKSTTGFGHKILSAQGWKPGDYLGAENASHAEHYTSANASHIRVMLREDNLGLGAQIGKGNAETFGLSMFSGLLGRLNGKSDAELEAQQQARRDAEIKIQHEQKYGFLNFVSGGFLIGDKIEEKKMIQPSTSNTKRKREEDPDSGKDKIPSQTTTGKPKVDSTENLSSESDADGIEESAKVKKHRKEHKKARSSANSAQENEKAKAKAERRAQKEERRRQKEERRQRRALKKAAKLAKEKAATSSASASLAASNPVPNNGSRHATRQRYIQQKRMASMDPKALKEIFMLQAK